MVLLIKAPDSSHQNLEIHQKTKVVLWFLIEPTQKPIRFQMTNILNYKFHVIKTYGFLWFLREIHQKTHGFLWFLMEIHPKTHGFLWFLMEIHQKFNGFKKPIGFLWFSFFPISNKQMNHPIKTMVLSTKPIGFPSKTNGFPSKTYGFPPCFLP